MIGIKLARRDLNEKLFQGLDDRGDRNIVHRPALSVAA